MLVFVRDSFQETCTNPSRRYGIKQEGLLKAERKKKLYIKEMIICFQIRSFKALYMARMIFREIWNRARLV